MLSSHGRKRAWRFRHHAVLNEVEARTGVSSRAWTNIHSNARADGPTAKEPNRRSGTHLCLDFRGLRALTFHGHWCRRALRCLGDFARAITTQQLLRSKLAEIYVSSFTSVCCR